MQHGFAARGLVYPQYDVQPFAAATLAHSPLVLIGTFTALNAQRQPTGTREMYRICFALADLKSGKLVSKGLAFSKTDGVDATPTASYRDAPAWSEDAATQGKSAAARARRRETRSTRFTPSASPLRRSSPKRSKPTTRAAASSHSTST